MAYTTEKISSNQVRLDFTVSAVEFEAAMQKAYLRERSRIGVPGFRKGKAPRRLIENMYGEAVFYDAAFDIIFPDLYTKAVEEAKLEVVDQPSVDVKEIGSGKDLVFSATVYVMPEVTLGDYKGLSAVRAVSLVTDDDVAARIEQDVRKATTTMEVSDRAVENGDHCTLDYSGSVDGVKFDGGTAEKQRLVIGSNSFIPGFEAQMIGMRIGEEKDITVTFPEQYHAENLAGKEAVFHIKLHGIEAEVKPEVDDEFVKDVSEFQTVAEYKDAIKKELEGNAEKQADVSLENNLLQQAVDAADCDIPNAMVEREIDMQVRNMRMRMMYQGLRYEDYLAYTGMTEESVRDMMRADAANHVKTQLVLEAIVKKEDVQVSEDELAAEVSRRAEEMKKDVEEYRKGLSDSQVENFKDLVRIQKVVALIKDSAKVETKTQTAESLDAQAVLEETEKAIKAEEKKTRKTTKATKGKEAEEKAE